MSLFTQSQSIFHSPLLFLFSKFIILVLCVNLAWAQESPAPIDSCQKGCVIHAECGPGGYCNAGLCKYKAQYCTSPRWATNDRGESTNCQAYNCSEELGICRRSAQRTEECSFGFTFDGQSQCVPTVACDPQNLQDLACQNLWARWRTAREQFELSTPEPHPPQLSCRACESNQQCLNGEMCWNGTCHRESLFCGVTESGEAAVFSNGQIQMACGNYQCDAVLNSCLSDCLSNLDCRPGKLCVAQICL